MSDTKIEWADVTWNPVRGCSRVSEGCRNCYAEHHAARFSGPGMAWDGFATRTSSGPRWTGKVALVLKKLREPLSWPTPRRVFVNSMSDLFHEDLEFKEIALVFGIMQSAKRHTYLVLTKRPERMRAFVQWFSDEWLLRGDWAKEYGHVWLGVSVEDQATVDARIPHLLLTPAAVRFVSAEPLLARVNFGGLLDGGPCPNALEGRSRYPNDVDWVIVGGESGPDARRCNEYWIRDVVAQCRAAETPCFVKQLGARLDCLWSPGDPEPPRPGDYSHPRAWPKDKWMGYRNLKGGTRPHVLFKNRKGGDPLEWPADLRVREFPVQ